MATIIRFLKHPLVRKLALAVVAVISSEVRKAKEKRL